MESQVRRPDQCPQCGSFDWIALYRDGRRYDAWKKSAPLWDKCRCRECGKEWDFKFISLLESA
jgi:hypothetical protein